MLLYADEDFALPAVGNFEYGVTTC